MTSSEEETQSLLPGTSEDGISKDVKRTPINND